MRTLRDVPADARHVLCTHRSCAPEHAGLVMQLCRTDRSVLPRWHQDDRGRRERHRGIHVQAPEGAYARIPIWGSRARWQMACSLATAVYANVLRSHQVSAATFRAYALVRSGYADPRTGRRCVVRPATIASAMGVAENTVQRCQRVARQIGLERVVLAGRMLTRDECWAARRAGSRQRGLSTEVALTIPKRLAVVVEPVTPTSGSTASRTPHPHLPSPGAASGDQTDAAPPRPPTSRRPGTAHGTRRGRRKAPGGALAADLRSRLPWLAGEASGRLAPALSRFATAGRPWSAADLVAALDALHSRLGMSRPQPEQITTRPAALLAWLLRHIDPELDHPGDPFTPAPPLEPCGSPGCDHGWITTTDHHGRLVAAKCLTCHPSVRGPLLPDDVLPEDEPPF